MEGSKIGPRLGENGLKIDIFWFVDFPLSGWRHLSKLVIYMIMIRLFLGIIGATHQSKLITPRKEKNKASRGVVFFFYVVGNRQDEMRYAVCILTFSVCFALTGWGMCWSLALAQCHLKNGGTLWKIPHHTIMPSHHRSPNLLFLCRIARQCTIRSLTPHPQINPPPPKTLGSYSGVLCWKHLGGLFFGLV